MTMEQGQPGRAGRPRADHGGDGADHHRAGEEGLDLEQVGGAAVGRLVHLHRTPAAAGDAHRASTATGRKYLFPLT